jgi:predicted ATP-dependent endonuclease of OLD family
LNIAELSDAVTGATAAKRLIIDDILRPYVDGVAARLDALQRLQRLLTLFLDAINSFFVNKRIEFDLTKGFTLVSKNGELLRPGALSSGEKQLLLLFCNVVTMRNRASVFLIDEPELSLNIKWQRQLLSSLLSLVSERTVQFVVATHSIELLANYKANVMPLSTVE